MERVFILIDSWQCDSGDVGQEVLVYSDFDQANKEMKKRIKQAKKDFKDMDTQEDSYCDGDMQWSIWERDNYCYNHIDITIYEREVL